MKKCLAFLLVLAMLLLVGCQSGDKNLSDEDVTAQETHQEEVGETLQEEKNDEPVSEETASEDIVTEETESEEQKKAFQEMPHEAETEPAFEAYTEKIKRHDQPIFDMPSYDGVSKKTVEEAGVYTIVEEVTDEEGNLWGRLKSGAGWVDLTDIRNFPWPISANFAGSKLLESGEYHTLETEQQDYAIKIAFYAYENVTDITIYPMEFTNEGFTACQPVAHISEFTPEKPLVAELSFPGDMSMYTVEFTDEQGAQCFFSLYISGRNGMLVMSDEEY